MCKEKVLALDLDPHSIWVDNPNNITSNSWFHFLVFWKLLAIYISVLSMHVIVDAQCWSQSSIKPIHYLTRNWLLVEWWSCNLTIYIDPNVILVQVGIMYKRLVFIHNSSFCFSSAVVLNFVDCTAFNIMANHLLYLWGFQHKS